MMRFENVSELEILSKISACQRSNPVEKNMNGVPRKAALFCIAAILALTASATEMTTDQRRSIDRLKATPVADIESGMPETALHQWLSENSHGWDIEYQIEPCTNMIPKEKQGAYPADSVCIVATMARGGIVLRFIDTGPAKGDRCSGCSFLNGQEGPRPGSHMARMTRLIKKLRELCTLLNWRC